ncbi:MAG TPA: MarR family transcriptional regulator [Nevskia sp.]|jgi:DNA-binding MarR family transcriptional regulator|nr:MarR family transcriptional regulator [Nevskia sp.]
MDSLRNFGFLLKDVSRLSSLNFEREATGLNLTMAQCKVLVYLQRNQGITQVRLAYLTDTDPMTLVRILDRMEADGWIERRPDPADRRARRLYLKDAAYPVVDEIWRIADRARAASLAGLSSAERDTLMSLLGRIHHNLTNLVPNADPAVPCALPAGEAPGKTAAARRAGKTKASP